MENTDQQTKERVRQPVGVFDSGVGGISVLRELIKVMPNEDYIYLGDSRNAPYGTKSLEQVRELSFHNAGVLLEQGAKGPATRQRVQPCVSCVACIRNCRL